jgi:LAS superfamily LD-carboxypeptidase LdcB
MAHDPKKINKNLQDLAPFFSQLLQLAIAEAQEQGYPVFLFEGYRSPERQDYLFSQGRSREGKIITKARAWHSWHQFGLAADLAFKKDGKWAWSKDDPWEKVHDIMEEYGFETLSWEQAHVQMIGSFNIAKASKIAKDHGLLVLWSIIESDFNGARN